MVFDLRNYPLGFDSSGDNFLLPEYIPYITPNRENNTLVNRVTGKILSDITPSDITAAIGAAALVGLAEKGITTLANLILQRKKKQESVDRCFTPLHNVVCDPGYIHPDPKFGGNIHFGNREAIKRLANKWFAKVPIVSSIAVKLGYHAWKQIKILRKFQCTLKNDDLARNVLAIGSPRSTFVAKTALGYTNDASGKLILQDDFKGILRWEFNVDYENNVKINQKIEGLKENDVFDHETLPYYFYDTNKSEDIKPPISNSQPEYEYAVLTKIPNRLVKNEYNTNTLIYIFKGLHSVGTKAVGDLIWEHIDNLQEKFKEKNILDPVNDSYQILFGFPVARYPNKPFEPILNQSTVIDVHRLSKADVNNLPDYRDNYTEY